MSISLTASTDERLARTMSWPMAGQYKQRTWRLPRGDEAEAKVAAAVQQPSKNKHLESRASASVIVWLSCCFLNFSSNC